MSDQVAVPSPADEDPEVARKLEGLANVFGKEFAERLRDPVMYMKQTLCAPMPQAMFRRDFELLSRSLFLESVYRRRVGYNYDVLDNFAKMVGEKLVDIGTLFDKRTPQMLHLFKQNGFDPEPVYFKSQSLYIPIIAPAARSFVKLLERLDNYYQLTGHAALLGLIDGGQRRKSELEMRKAVRAFTGLVRTEHVKMRRESWRLNSERSAHPVDAEEEAMTTMAENLVAQSEKKIDEATDDSESHVGMDEAGAVLDSIVANGVAAATASGRRSRAAAPATATSPAPAAS